MKAIRNINNKNNSRRASQAERAQRANKAEDLGRKNRLNLPVLIRTKQLKDSASRNDNLLRLGLRKVTKDRIRDSRRLLQREVVQIKRHPYKSDCADSALLQLAITNRE